jgi:hypothetical protein
MGEIYSIAAVRDIVSRRQSATGLDSIDDLGLWDIMSQGTCCRRPPDLTNQWPPAPGRAGPALH